MIPSLLLALALCLSAIALFQSLPGCFSWKFRHRNSCGRQQFIPRRREILSRSFLRSPFGLHIETVCDTRAACPKCGRIHRFTEVILSPAVPTWEEGSK